ncbi:MAG: phosphate ABC transporter ATP-binding protein, partial [Burkholderiaceae bacterium]|nr:phosphate ABC transporter ATP-binding protein [Burkholderiaceae bacterium]
LIRAHGVDANILHGQIDEIQGQPFGALAVYVSGPARAVRAVAAGLAGAGVQVRDVTDAPQTQV